MHIEDEVSQARASAHDLLARARMRHKYGDAVPTLFEPDMEEFWAHDHLT